MSDVNSEAKQGSMEIFFNGLVKEKSHLCADARHVSDARGDDIGGQRTWHGADHDGSARTQQRHYIVAEAHYSKSGANPGIYRDRGIFRDNGGAAA